MARFEVFRRFFKMKMRDGQFVHDHCLTMIKDIEELQKLEMNMDKELQVDLIIQPLSDSYRQFIMNYHINKIDSTLPELLNILITAEGTLKSSRRTVLPMEQIFFKRKSTGKKNKKPAKKQKTESGKKRKAPKKASDKKKYFHCNVEDH